MPSSRRDAVTAKQVWPMSSTDMGVKGRATKDLEGIGSPPFRCRTITVMFVEQAGLPAAVQTATYNRERLARRHLDDLLGQAKQAKWRSDKSLKDHWQRHGRTAGQSIAQYSQAAIDDFRRAGRDIYTTVSRGRPQLVAISRRDRKTWVTVIDVQANTIVTRHRRPSVDSWLERRDNEAVVNQRARGFMKWLR